MAEIGIADAVASVREELTRAVLAAEEADFQFPVEGVELEFEVAVTRSVETGGKARFWVLEWGASGARGSGTTHRVTITLGSPVNRNGEIVKVFRRSAEKP